MQRLLISFINFYQAYLSFDKGALSLFVPGGACKNNPSCSQYAKESIREFGVFKGGWMGLERIWSCK